MDFSKASGATFRKVDSGERNGKLTHIIRMSRSYPTTPTDLWSALTEMKRICCWFAEISGNLELDGRFSIKGNAEGDITVCKPPNSLSLTWKFGSNRSWVTVIVEPAKEGSLLTLEHELPTDEESEAHWDQYGPGATGVGWEMAIFGLDIHLSSDGQPSIEAGTSWAEDAQGKATLRTWAQAWGEAHIRAGAQEQTAKNTAERTAKFYTGEA